MDKEIKITDITPTKQCGDPVLVDFEVKLENDNAGKYLDLIAGAYVNI